MVESSVSPHEEWDADRIRETYPNGAFLYYAPTGDVKEIRITLSKALPDTFISVIDRIHRFTPFPADGAVQVGDRAFVMSTGVSYYSMIFRQFDGLSNQEAATLIPKFVYPQNEWGFPVVGGETIRVGGCDDVWFTGLNDSEFSTATDGLDGVYSMFVLRRMVRGLKKTESPKIIDNILYYDTPETGAEFSHEDLLTTAFMRPGGGYVWYVDEPLRTFALQRGGAEIRSLFKTSRLCRHDFTSRGALNIQYGFNRRKNMYIAIVPSADALGPIAGELHKSGYDIVELGDDQFSHKSGVKCRSLHIQWREQ